MRAERCAFDDPVECQGCGYVTERRRLDDEAFVRRSVAGIRYLAPGDCEPDEYVSVCPVCGAWESFDTAVRCAECGAFPCICNEEP